VRGRALAVNPPFVLERMDRHTEPGEAFDPAGGRV
jgi:hypothetical protein